MYFSECINCRHGSDQDGKSHCGKEAVYSHLTRCLQQKAMEYYLEQKTVANLQVELVGNL
jgi:hypothetical protein